MSKGLPKPPGLPTPKLPDPYDPFSIGDGLYTDQWGGIFTTKSAAIDSKVSREQAGAVGPTSGNCGQSGDIFRKQGK
jgi:hypothetical protein